jgi:putative nucleotide binding protein
VGAKHFTLLELTPKAGADIKIGDKVYVGKDDRDKVEFIKGRISYEDLTNTAISELEKTIDRIVVEDEKRFVEFYNTSAPITIKRHRLELLPGLGKKHMQNIVQEREKEPFKSYGDIVKRVPQVPKPARLVARRILEELSEKDIKYYLFSRPPAKKREFRREYRRDFRGPGQA